MKDINSILERSVQFKTGQYLSEGFRIFKSEAGFFVVYVLAYFAITIFASMVPLASIFLQGPLLIGFLVMAHSIIHKESTAFGTFFKGFDNMLQMAVITLLTSLMSLIAIIPFLFSIMFCFEDIIRNADELADETPYTEDLATVLGLIFKCFPASVWYALFLGIVIFVLVIILFFFAYPFAHFYKQDAIPALGSSRKLVSKYYGSVLGFTLILGFLNILGTLVCGFGLLITIPISYCATYAAFADLTGLNEETPEQENNIIEHLID